MPQPNRRNEQQWEYIQEWLGSPKGVTMLIGFAAIWAITGFNPWVAFGLSMGALGTARKYADNRRREKLDEFLEKAEIWEASQFSNIDEPEEIKSASLNNALHEKVIEDAKSDLLQIKVASGVASGELGENLQKIVQHAENIERDLLRAPHKLSQVQRIFTYYIPSTQDLLIARGKAQANNDATKLAEIDTMFSRLALAYQDFAQKMHGEDARSVDIDIKLLDQSLAQDLGMELQNTLRNKDKI
jgi:hypothetical protein